MVESHTLRRLSLVDSRVASRRPLPPRGCYATFADQDNALADTVVWPPDSDLTLCTRLRTDRTVASSELARIDRRCHPSPFVVGQHQSQLADHAQRGPSPDFPGLLDRLPGGCHAADPSKTTSAAGLPRHRVRSSIRLDGHGLLACVLLLLTEVRTGRAGPFLATPGWGPERLARSCTAMSGSEDFPWLALSSAPLFPRLRRTFLPDPSRDQRPAARCLSTRSPKAPTSPSPARLAPARTCPKAGRSQQRWR